jgi:hypothetical protein
VTIGIDTGFLDQLESFGIGSILPSRSNQTMLDIASDRSSKQSRLLRDETDLLSKPLDVESLDVVTVKVDGTLDRIVESFRQCDNGTLSTSASTDKSDGGPSLESRSVVPENRDIRSRGVMELDVFEGNDTLDVIKSKSVGRSRIDSRDSVDSLEKLGGGALSFTNGLHLGSQHGKREGSDDDREKDIDDDTRIGLTSGDEDTSEEEG